jgi:hypothetical protein
MPANNEKGRKLLALVCSSVFMATALYFSGKNSSRPNDLEARVLKLELEARVNKLGSQVEELQATAREPWTPKIKYSIRYPKNMINASKSLYFSAEACKHFKYLNISRTVRALVPRCMTKRPASRVGASGGPC